MIPSKIEGTKTDPNRIENNDGFYLNYLSQKYPWLSVEDIRKAMVNDGPYVKHIERHLSAIHRVAAR